MDLLFIQGLVDTYGGFFSWETISATLSNPANWGIIFSLIILEGLLSADNALVLAAMVKKLPLHQRKKALMYGIWGAYAFRFLAIGFGVYLVQFMWVKVLGGGYLVFMAVSFFYKHFKNKGNEDSEEVDSDDGITQTGIIYRLMGQFWGTVFMVEIMDIAFSIDSVLAAFAVSDQLWVLLLGGIFGVLMMRGVAGVFLKLLEKIPELEASAFLIILFIGTKMVLSGFGIHLTDNETMEHIVFFSVLGLIFGGTIALHYLKKPKQA